MQRLAVRIEIDLERVLLDAHLHLTGGESVGLLDIDHLAGTQLREGIPEQFDQALFYFGIGRHHLMYPSAQAYYECCILIVGYT